MQIKQRKKFKKLSANVLCTSLGCFILARYWFLLYAATDSHNCEHSTSGTATLTANNQVVKKSPVHTVITATTKDPELEPANCRALLQDFHAGNLLPLQKEGFDKSYIGRTTEQPKGKSFAVSTHAVEIDNTRYAIFAKGVYYERKLTQAIADTFDAKGHRESIMLDVGGNIGWFSLVAAAHGAVVYTFEPNIQNVIRYCESVTLNGWVNNNGDDFMHMYMKGVGSVHGEKLPLYQINGLNPGSFSFSKNQMKRFNSEGLKKDKKDIEGVLPLITLDALAEEKGWFESRPSIGFMKIDVEGGEPDVLTGALKLLNSKLVENIAMEMMRRTYRKDYMLKVLYDAGFVLYKIGNFKGPSYVPDKAYDSWEELVKDIDEGMYKHQDNFWFRLKELV